MPPPGGGSIASVPSRSKTQTRRRRSVVLAGVPHLFRGRPERPSREGFSSEEVTLNWNKLVRQAHRWLSIAFTLAVIINIVAVLQKKETVVVGLLALFPLVLLLVTGWYLFVLPYAAKWRSGRGSE